MSNSGTKLWDRAKAVIPGGNMLLSKRSEMFLPEHWPSYFTKTDGYKVWDLDGTLYKDMSIMGIGTNSLGYSNPEVDDAVKSAITSGNMSTLNCPEEVYLAEKLIELHPWAGMVKLCRSGGEANAIAIRIARAYSGKDNVAFCGYHGWHDWYLSSNIGPQDSLDGHLLPGLEANGVPATLKDTAFAFEYNDFSKLEYLVKNCNVGTIKMEVIRNQEPKDDFLKKVRKLATENNVILIFDECTSGFREAFGGIHKNYKVEPDIAMFGKALGNGYAITAVVGKKQVMEAAQSTFISSTFWTERVGPVAALKTLEIMLRNKSWKKITDTGNTIKKKWQNLADKHDLKIEHFGIPALAGFNFSSAKNLEYKTLITQEMLKKGFLATNTVYSCYEHDTEVIEEYFHVLEDIFSSISECENGRNILELLDGPVCHASFKRLN
jgi:glutamate-1-semialdehyde 2,1-aminomutase